MTIPFRLLLPVLALVLQPAQATEIIAHRGASFDAPENTLPSVMAGWEQGADAVEVDVYLTADNRIAVLHDKTTARTTGQDLVVKEETLEALTRLDAGSWKGEAWVETRIPSLSEVIATIPDGKSLFIEIKCGPEILPALKELLEGAGKLPSQTHIIAFNFETVKQARQLLPGLKVYWLVSPEKRSGGLKPSVEDMIEKAAAAGLDGLDLSAGFALDRSFVEKVHAAGMGLYVWTVNDPEVAHHLSEIGVDGITTDRPGWLREQLQSP